jgi:putative ATP-dependent endonuclease of OLD family
MQISSIQVKNLRSLQDVSFQVDPLTALIGGNNAGKSTILKAIELFFDSSPKLTFEDFTYGCEKESIEITLGFNNLNPDEIEEFGTAVVNDQLIVRRHFSLEDPTSGQYSAQAAVNPVFSAIRSEKNGNRRRAMYRELTEQFADLPEIQSHTEIDDMLKVWERDHTDSLELQYERGFFGAPNVANGKLRKKTSVHLVPAVRDVSADAAEPKSSPILALLSDIARQTLENRREMADFLEESQRRFAELSDPSQVPELIGISDSLTESVQRFYPDSTLTASWQDGNGLSVTYPIPRLRVNHGGVSTELSRVGHGLQRAALFSVVQFLAEQRSVHEDQEEFPEAVSDIIILVEEPEIYQHPSKQLVIFDAFKSITQGHNSGTGIRVQVIYCTHSEKFVQMADFDIARIVRRQQEEEGFSNSVAELSISSCSAAFADYFDPPRDPMPPEAFKSKLHIFTREVCEGFFADTVILVEGVTDKAVLEAYYRLIGRDVHKESIVIISVEGKTKMDKPAYVFSQLGIPTFLIFDNDSQKANSEKKPQTNVLWAVTRLRWQRNRAGTNSADASLRWRISGDPGPLGAPFCREMVPQEGFEPPTPSLRMMCSTN